MAPRFRKKDKSSEAALRRIACAQLDKALALIEAPELSDARKVHKVRQTCKALRGLIRLVRPRFEGFGLVDREFRDIARSLAGARDAAVLIATLEDLAGRGKPVPGFDLAAVRAGLRAETPLADDMAERLRHCAERLTQARGHAAHWTLSANGWDAIGPGLERCYRDARHAMRQTATGDDPQASHDWRKQVKYHAAHVRYLVAIRPEPLKARASNLDRIGELLGDAHDLELLLDALVATPRRFGGIVGATSLAALARRRKARLDTKALRLGEAMFAQKPRVMAAHWAGWWTDWKGKYA